MKGTLIVVPLLALAGLALALGRPAAGSIDSLFDGFFREWIAMNPDDATQFGLTADMGYPCKKSALTDGSERLVDRTYEFYRNYQARLDACDRAVFTGSQRRDAEILAWHLNHMLAGEKFRDHAYVINHYFGVHSALTNLLTEYHTIVIAQDARDYLARLKRVPRRLDQTLERLAIQEKMGIRPPGYIIDAMDSVMTRFAGDPADSNVLFASFGSRIEAASGINPRQKGALLGSARDIIQNEIYPAYRRFVAVLRRSRPLADTAAGVWKLPGGDAYYKWCLKYHTTTALTPDEIHQLGLREVARLQDEARSLMKQLGLSGGPVFSSWMNSYWQHLYDPSQAGKYTYSRNEGVRDQVVGDYQKIIDQAWSKLPAAFSQIPKTSVSARAVPHHKEATSSTYYEPASLDGKRQGVFYVNLSWSIPDKPSMPSLTYHETVPGHHFQIAIQQEQPDNRMFKNLLFFTGFGEGWALYSEQLAFEQDWFQDIPARIANRTSLLFRAVRLVLDTGIHEKRWTRDQAMQYMRDNLGWAATGELDRYILWPGQACAYYVGMLKIVELREKAKKELGAKFDLRNFHRVLLENGTMPLELAERQIDNYIAANR